MIINKIIRLLWPEVCPFCGKVSREGICLACREKINHLVIRHPKCMKCGKPVRKNEQEYCYDCTHTHHHYDKGVALWLHKPPVSTSVYQFKYHNHRTFGKYYVEEILKVYGGILRKWKIDIIIPIPLHPRRRRKRGYNQAAIVAEGIGENLNIPVDEKCVKRIRYTVPQKKMDHSSRRRNLKGAFRVTASFRPVKTVLLVDDIYTTGNTIDEISLILRRAGVEKIYFLTISIGEGD